MGDPGLTGLAGSLSRATGAMAGVADTIGKVRCGVWVPSAAHHLSSCVSHAPDAGMDELLAAEQGNQLLTSVPSQHLQYLLWRPVADQLSTALPAGGPRQGPYEPWHSPMPEPPHQGLPMHLQHRRPPFDPGMGPLGLHPRQQQPWLPHPGMPPAGYLGTPPGMPRPPFPP